MSGTSQARFQGTERFNLLAILGRGATGVVYEAVDRETDARVAVKVLGYRNPESIYFFKNEFRALQGVRHRNLLELRELLFEQGQWLLVMELVRGVDVVAHACGLNASASNPTHSPKPRALPDDETIGAGPAKRSSRAVGTRVESPFCEQKVRTSFRQLAEGLVALHAANKVHRDLKPSNVLVTAEQRLVILDFGLVADLGTTGSIQQRQVLGTLPYMAPEQVRLKMVSPASDWFSVGVMLYETLTGSLPFVGSPGDVPFAQPPAPSLVREGVPTDLSDLCMDLLNEEPDARPSGSSVLARLASPHVVISAHNVSLGHGIESAFVGRIAELEKLHCALARVRGGETLSVVVTGESGVGKTSLINQFLQQVSANGELSGAPQVFRGRCFERESLPYKALDGVMDAVCGELSKLSPAELIDILPRNAAAITQAFPVFSRIEQALGDMPAEPRAQRLRVFAALRELFVRLSRANLTIVVIDDMQWADVDSLVLLSAMLRPLDAPPMLLITMTRPGSSVAQGCLPGEGLVIPLGPLSDEESLALVRELLGSNGLADHSALQGYTSGALRADRRALRLTSEAQGHPLFLREMVRQMSTCSDETRAPVKLGETLWARVAALPPLTRRMMTLTAVAARPIAQGILAEAWAQAGLDETEAVEGRTPTFESTVGHMAELRHACLIRTTGAHPKDTIEPFHDRIREAVLANLDPRLRKQSHHFLALALEQAERRDFEALAVHWQHAGDGDRAHQNAVLAAEQAAEVLAFERAARLYRLSIDVVTLDIVTRRRLLTKLGDALANAGRGVDAAEAYEAAALDLETLEGLRLRRRAAEQLLRSGHLDRGLNLVSKVLSEMGVTTKESGLGAIISLALLRGWIRARGYRYKQRSEAEIEPFELDRIDGTWMAATCLTVFDSVRSAELQCKGTLLALRAGTPLQVLRAYTSEAMFIALGGQSQRARIGRLLSSATVLAEQLGHAHAKAWVALSRGASAFFLGSWQEGEDQCRIAEAIFQQRAGALFELSSCRAFGIWSTMMRGEFREVLARVPRYVEEAEDRGDLYGATYQMTGFSNVAWLSIDNVPEARRMLALAERRWSSASYDVPLYLNMVAAAHIELYDGAGVAAHTRVLRDWRLLRWGVAFRGQMTRFGMRFVRGLSALAAYDETRQSRLLYEAESCARAIAAERVVWSECFAEILLAGASSRRGKPQQGVLHLLRAEEKTLATGMSLHRAVVRHRRGEIIGGEAGSRLKAESQAFMAEQQINNPTRMLNMLSPKFE